MLGSLGRVQLKCFSNGVSNSILPAKPCVVVCWNRSDVNKYWVWCFCIERCIVHKAVIHATRDTWITSKFMLAAAINVGDIKKSNE